MITMNTNANSPQVKPDTAAQSAVQNAGKQKVNQAAVEQRVETRVESSAKSEVKREEAGKDAAKEMAKQNAITEKPDDGIRLEISRQGLEKEKQAQRPADDEAQKKAQERSQATQKQDDMSAAKQRIEEQQKVREKIKEQVERELNDEKKEVRQTEQKDQDQNRRRIDAQDEQNKDAQKKNITNYAGYTNAQLQQMAQRGEISQNDYRTEIENREEKLAEEKQSLMNTERTLAKDMYRADRVERDMGAIETAFSEDSNDSINAQTRNEIVQNLENPQNTETQRENNQREQQARAFAQWQSDFGFLIR